MSTRRAGPRFPTERSRTLCRVDPRVLGTPADADPVAERKRGPAEPLRGYPRDDGKGVCDGNRATPARACVGEVGDDTGQLGPRFRLRRQADHLRTHHEDCRDVGRYREIVGDESSKNAPPLHGDAADRTGPLDEPTAETVRFADEV